MNRNWYNQNPTPILKNRKAMNRNWYNQNPTPALKNRKAMSRYWYNQNPNSALQKIEKNNEQELYNQNPTPALKNRKAMNRNWCKQTANPALITKMGNKYILHIDKIQWEQIAGRAGSYFPKGAHSATQNLKPKREITNIINSRNTKRTYGQPIEQLLAKRWPLSNRNRTKNNMNKRQ